MSWLKPPQTMVVSGDHEFKREREIRKAMQAASLAGRVIEVVDVAENSSALANLLSGNALFQQSMLVIVTTPEKGDLDFYQEHENGGDTSVCLLLHVRGNIRSNSRFAKFVDRLPKSRWLHFKEPPPWEASEEAVRFCVAEAKAASKELPEKLAKGIVTLCGEELGFLSFEIRKLCLYMDAVGAKKAEADHVRAVLVPFLTDATASPLIDALASKNEKALIKQLQTLGRSHTSEPTMYVCASVGAVALQWLQALDLAKSGISSAAAAPQIGVSPYRLDRALMPAARRWGEKGIMSLICEIATVENAVRSGKISPWIMLQTRLITLCRGSEAGG